MITRFVQYTMTDVIKSMANQDEHREVVHLKTMNNNDCLKLN